MNEILVYCWRFFGTTIFLSPNNRVSFNLVEKVKTFYIDVSVLHLFLEIRHFSLRRKYTVEMFLKPSRSTFFGGFNKKKKNQLFLISLQVWYHFFQFYENQSAM